MPTSLIEYRIPYTNRDFTSIREAVVAQIPPNVPEWNDFLQSNYGMFIMSTFAAIGDWLAFYSDRNAAECFVKTALGKNNLADIFQLINYQLRGPVPSFTTIRVTLNAALDNDVLIPKYSEFADLTGSNRFISTGGATISAGSMYVDVEARQGSWQTESFTSNGGVQQRFILGRTDIAEGFIRVWVGQEEWTQASDNTFVGQAFNARVFRIIRTAVNAGGPQTATPALAPELVVTSIEFGDDLEGKKPPSGMPVRVDYVTTLGDSIRVPAGAISSAVSLFVTANGDPVDVIVSNIDSASGGDQAESAYAARRRYPAAFRTMRRAVTTFDFQTYAEHFDGVLLAKVYDLNNNADNNNNLTPQRPIPIEKAIPFFQARVYVIPRADFSSEALNRTLREWLQARASVITQIIVLNPTRVSLSINVRIRVYPNYNVEDVKHAVVEAIRDFFRITRDGQIQIGTPFYASRLIARIQQIPGVSFLDLLQPTADVTIGFDEIISLNNVQVELDTSTV